MSTTDPKIVIVDKDNNVIGVSERVEAHKKGLRHRIARIFLFNSKGQLFLQQRSLEVDNFPGLWDQSVGGHVDEGEDDRIAAIREMEEEIGLKNVELKEIGTYYTESKNGGKIFNRFNTLYVAVSDEPLTLDPEEVAGGKWITIEELDELIKKDESEFTEGLINALKFYKEHR